MRSALSVDMLATDLAYYLVRKGVRMLLFFAMSSRVLLVVPQQGWGTYLLSRAAAA